MSPRYRYLTADVFTDRIFGGNPLAVFPDARGLETKRMQAIARELNLPETVFVFPAERSEHTRRLRIFAPGSELPFAGHPTVGCAIVLAAIGEIPLRGEPTRIVFEEGVGPVPVAIREQDGRPTFAQLTAGRLPEFGPPAPSREEIAAVLSLSTDDFAAEKFAPAGVSAGVPFLVVPLRDLGALGRARLDFAVWERSFARSWAPHLYPITLEPGEAGLDVRARMFAPALGIAEDPATGAAAVALAGYLAARRRERSGTLRWVIEQGVEMGRPSRLHLEADMADGRLAAVRVGGAAVIVSEGSMTVPEPD